MVAVWQQPNASTETKGRGWQDNPHGAAPLTLPISLTDETVPQEAIFLVPGVAHGGEHAELAWQFDQEHMTERLGRAEEFTRNMYVPGTVEHRTVEH
jgi:hypothetical protein